MINKKIFFYSIITTGRTGSDYLEACIDGLSSVLTIPNKIFYYKFCKKNNIKQSNRINTKELLKNFIENNKILFHGSRLENKYYSINKEKFINLFNKIYKQKLITRDKFLINLYISFALYLKQNIKKKYNLIYHAHHWDENAEFQKDFKDIKLFITIRDPKENLYSGIYNWRRFDKNKNNQEHNFKYLKRIIEDLNQALKISNKKIFIKLEDANKKKIKKKICNFLKNKFENKIFTATYFNNKKWNGDQLSLKKSNGIYNNSINNFRQLKKFSSHDIKLLNCLFFKYKKFNYDLKPKHSLFKLLLFSWKPFSFEIETFKYIIKKKSIIYISKNFFWYLLRTIYIYRKIFYYAIHR